MAGEYLAFSNDELRPLKTITQITICKYLLSIVLLSCGLFVTQVESLLFSVKLNTYEILGCSGVKLGLLIKMPNKDDFRSLDANFKSHIFERPIYIKS